MYFKTQCRHWANIQNSRGHIFLNIHNITSYNVAHLHRNWHSSLCSIRKTRVRARFLISYAGKPRNSLRVMAVWGSPCKPERGSSCLRHVGVVLQRAEDTLNRAEVSQPPSCLSINPSLSIRPLTATGRVQHPQHHSFSGSAATRFTPWSTVDEGETHRVMLRLQLANPAPPKTVHTPVRSRRAFPVICNSPWRCPTQTSWV